MTGFIIMYLLLIPGVAWFLHSKYVYKGEFLPTAGIKGGCTLLIVFCSVVQAANAPETLRVYAIWITFGLAAGLVGDILICGKGNEGFWFGILYFGLGHVCYITAYLHISAHPLRAIWIFLVIYSLVILTAVRLLIHKKKENSMRQGGLKEVSNKMVILAAIVYSMTITVMVSLSATVAMSVQYGWIVCLGAVLFAISDSLLAYGKMVKEVSKGMDCFGLYCYFIGQSLFAMSIYLFSGSFL